MKNKRPTETGGTPKQQGSHSGHDMAALFKDNEKALKISAALTGIYFLIEMGLGVVSGSISVISDAFHTFSAVGGVLLALIAGRIAGRPADRYRTYGNIRAEIIGALLNGLFLLLMAVFVIYMGIKRFFDPVELDYGLMLWAAAGGLVTEVISLRLLTKNSQDNLNMRGAFWHVMQTFVGSLIIIVAAVVIYFTGFVAIDPILGTGFGLVLIWAGWSITRDALNVLMETVPTNVDVEAVQSALFQIEGVKHIHHVHAWALTSGKNLFSAHLLIDANMDEDIVLEKATDIISDKFNFYFSTLQVEHFCAQAAKAQAIDFATNPDVSSDTDTHENLRPGRD